MSDTQGDKQQYSQFVTEYGMQPYNAAVRAGYDHEMALSLAAAAKMKELVSHYNHKNIAEQQGVTPKTIILHLLKMSGFNDREEGAKTIKACDVFIRAENDKLKVNKNSNDFIEVPDDRLQREYFKDLLEFIGYEHKDADKDKRKDDFKPFDIVIHVVNKDQPKQVVDAEVQQ